MLATQVVQWWANFARYGNPNGADDDYGSSSNGNNHVQASPFWPAFNVIVAAAALNTDAGGGGGAGTTNNSSSSSSIGTKEGENMVRSAMHIQTPASFVETGGQGLCSDLWDAIGYDY